jgi:ATP-dependent helicase HrpA
LQSRFSQKAGQTFDQIAADELNYTGCVQWAFDELPETYQFIQQGQAFIGYPAIVDEGDSVGVKIFDTRQKADDTHHDGLVRLFQLYLAKECKYLLKNMPHSPALELIYQKLSPHPLLSNYGGQSFKDDILYCVFSSVFLDEGLIRSQPIFEQRLDAHKSKLIQVTNEASLLAKEVMERVGAINRQLQRLNASDPLGNDINEQLSLLVFAGFIRRTPYQQLKQFPRYLKAVEYRLEKMNNDVQKQQEINRFCQRFWKEVAERARKKCVIPESDPFRWLLEEFRVSLYAQQLKTPFPVSAKRLEKAWDDRF